MIKKRINKRAMIITAIIAAVMALFEICIILSSSYYQEMYSLPRNINGVMDMSGYDQINNPVNADLEGEWEFFYNKWIITDRINNEPDCMINIPARWTGLTLNDEKLPRTGYASYRMKVENVLAGSELSITMYNFPGAYRAYINGQLVAVSGTISKDINETFSSGRMNEVYPYMVLEDGGVEIVVELSANSIGGMINSPRLKTERYNPVDQLLTISAYVFLGIMLAILVFSLIMDFGLYRKERQFSSSILLAAVFLHFLTTKEIYHKFSVFLNFNYAVVQYLNYITGMLVMAAFFVHLYLSKQIKFNRLSFGVLLGVNIVFTVMYFCFIGYSIQILFVALGLISIFYIFYLLSVARTKNQRFSIVNISMLFFLTALLSAEAMDNLGWIIYGMETPASVILLLFTITVLVMSFIKMRDSAKEAIRAIKLEQEIGVVKSNALKAQIKPHFVFNSLTSIQALYHKHTEDGDEALERFAQHLRLNIESDTKENIPFDEELNNILNYFELENMRLESRLVLYLDINYTDFSLPILTLQPLIENAIKYAGTDKIEGGFIQIFTMRDNGQIVIKVTDNGKGFDAQNIRKGATGLKNATERLKYTLNATVDVQSEIGIGTSVTITFPVKEKHA